MTSVSYRIPTNIRWHNTKFSSLSNLVPGICVPLILPLCSNIRGFYTVGTKNGMKIRICSGSVVFGIRLHHVKKYLLTFL
jgi:hypothetical protein